MGSPISLIVANLYMEDLEIKVINTTEHTPRVWKRYVDETLVVIELTKKQEFLEPLNKMAPHIQFTTEEMRADGTIHFLDTLVMSQPHTSLITTM